MYIVLYNHVHVHVYVHMQETTCTMYSTCMLYSVCTEHVHTTNECTCTPCNCH